MELSPYVSAVHRDLVATADAGGPEVRAAADRLAFALDPSLRLALLDALGAAAAEIGAALPAGGAVDVRLRGRDPEFVVALPSGELDPEPLAAAAPEPTGPAGEEPVDPDGGTARLTLRLPEALKARAEQAASRDGVSVNTWLVRAAQLALEASWAPVPPVPPGPPRPPGPPGRGAGRSAARGVGRRITGWAG